MKTINNLFLFVLMVFIISCNQEPKSSGLKNDYFDLNDYFNTQIKTLYDTRASLLITATANNKSEQRKNNNPDWKREFIQFINSDIHKPAFIGKYKSDSSVVTTVTDTLFLITYTTDDEELKTKKLEVYFTPDKKEVKKIYIVNSTKNFLSSYDEELTYTAGKGYKLNSVENTLLMGKSIYEIRAEFLFGAGYFQ